MSQQKQPFAPGLKPEPGRCLSPGSAGRCQAGCGGLRLWLGVLFVVLWGVSAHAAPTPRNVEALIPWSQLGTQASQQYGNGQALGVAATPEGARLHTDFQRLQGEVTAYGLRLKSTTDAKSSEYFTLRSQVLGREQGETSAFARTGRVEVDGDYVRWLRPGVVEEYSVSVDGVRQDFVLSESPAGTGDLVLELELEGARAETAADKEKGVRLILDGSGRALAYNRLKVWDAEGRVLPAQLRVVGADRLTIAVDDAGAVWPIRIDPTFSDGDWAALGAGVNHNVFALALDGSGGLYVGGAFTQAGGAAASLIAHWDGSNWSPLGTGLEQIYDEFMDYYFGQVNALAVDGAGGLYAGGNFAGAEGVANTEHFAYWNGTTWSAVGTGVNRRVNALVLDGAGGLYVAGDFTNGEVGNRIAHWNGTDTWTALGTGLNQFVNALVLDGTGGVYAAGNFTSAGGVSAVRIAHWNGTNTWTALGSGLDGVVRGLAPDGVGGVYAGGDFTNAGTRIAHWDGIDTWSALGAGVNGTVVALEPDGSGGVYAGGFFTDVGNYIAHWNGTNTWSNLGSSGLDSSVFVLTLDGGGGVYVGGGFSTAGGQAAANVAHVKLPAMAINAGNNQSATAGDAVATPPSVLVLDANNNPVSGVAVTFAVASGGGTVNPTTAVTTDANGIATVTSWTLGTAVGENTLTATSAGLTGSPVTFTATGTAGAASQMAINAGNNQSATAGDAVATPPSVLVRDANNNPVSGVEVTFAVASGSGTVEPTTAVTTNADGIAAVTSWTLGATAGENTLTANTGTALSSSPVIFTAMAPVASTQTVVHFASGSTFTVVNNGQYITTNTADIASVTVEQLLAGITLKTGASVQVKDAVGIDKANSDALAPGDTLTVIAEDTTTTRVYRLLGQPILVAGGGSHSVVSNQGVVFTFGNGSSGRLGHGADTSNQLAPKAIDGFGNIVAIAAGSLHSTILDADGQVLTFGAGANGRLGHGDLENQLSPKPIAGFGNIVAIAAGALHSIVLDEDGQVYTFGFGSSGRLGHGNEDDLNIPTAIAGLGNIVGIATGSNHSMLLDADGQVYTFGIGSLGRLGHGADTSNQFAPKAIAGFDNIIAIAGGGSHSMLLDADGQVYTFGSGYNGRLGHGNDDALYIPTAIAGFGNIVAIAGGESHSIILDADGQVYTFGNGYNGRLGHGADTSNQFAPKAIDGFDNIVAIAVGTSHNMLLDADGQVHTFGSGLIGRLGHCDTDNRLVPIAIGSVVGCDANLTLLDININAGNEQTAVAGTAVNVAASVLVRDANNNPVSGVKVTFAVASGGGTVDPTTAVTTDANGIAVVSSWTLGTTPGENTLTATTGTAVGGSPVTFTASALAIVALADVGSGGSMTPASQEVASGDTASFTLTPNDGHVIGTVSGCAGSLNGTTYTTGELSANCTVTASFIQVAISGSGSEADPFVINAGADLGNIRNHLDSHFKLVGDGAGRLDVGADWVPIGSAAVPFTGSIASQDGQPVAIAGLNGKPLFDVVGEGAEVSDLVIENSVNAAAGSHAGLLANVIQGSVTNPAVLRNITIDSTSSITGNDAIGGLAGTIEHANLSQVTVDADVTGANEVGGVAGNASNANIDGASVSGNVSASGDRVGGISGQMSDTSVSNASVTGTVSGANEVGGVAGNMSGGFINDAPVGITVSGSGNDVNPVVGMTSGGASITHRVTASASAGGVIDVDDVLIEDGESADFTVTSDDGHVITSVTGCNGSLNGNVFTTGAITNACAIAVDFSRVAASGSGTSDDPFVINDGADLSNIAAHLGSYFVLDGGADATLDVGANWSPLGSAVTPFVGSIASIDGKPVKLSGLGGQPVFGEIGPGATVSDLTIQGSQNLDAGDNAGLLAKVIKGSAEQPVRLDNILIDSSSRIDGGNRVGAIAGTLEHAHLNQVMVDAEVNGANEVGGVAGRITESTLKESRINGDVSGSGSEVGGIGGRITSTDMNDSVVTGRIDGASLVGGVSGTLDGGSAVDSTISGNVTGSGDQVGGIGGSINNAFVSGGLVVGDVSGNNQVGGIGGSVTGSSLVNSAVNGIVSGNGSSVDAIAGTLDDGSSIANVSSGSSGENQEPFGRVLFGSDGVPLGDGPLATGEEVRIVIEGAVLPLSINGTVTRGIDVFNLDSGTQSGIVLTDLQGGNPVLTFREGDYFFSAGRGGAYELVFEDRDSEAFTIAFDVRPQVAFSSTRQLGTGGTQVTVRAVLEGTPGQYPVRVPYAVVGHDLLDSSDLNAQGAFEFTADGPQARVRTLNLTPAGDVGEVAITLLQGSDPEDALLGNPSVHRIVLRQAQEVPLFVTLGAQQRGQAVGSLAESGNDPVTLTAQRPDTGEAYSDANHVFDWSESALELGIVNQTTASVQIDPSHLSQGQSFLVRVAVTETGTANTGTARLASAQMRLRFIGQGDGDALDAFAGFLDADPERSHRLPICPQGVDIFRDPGDRTCNSVDRSQRAIFLEAPEGYTVNLGSMAEQASWATRDFGLEVDTDEIRDGSGANAINARDTEFTHLGFRVDFEISDLEYPGQSVPVVIPLPAGEAIPADAVWRKYLRGGWRTFVENEANELFSARGSSDFGECPWPGSDRWTPGLTEGDNCVRLVIQDGGPNDFDGETDGVIRDPGTLAVASSADGGDQTGENSGSQTLKSNGGGGGLSSMGVMLFVLGALVLLRHRRSIALMALVMAGSAQADPETSWYVGAQWGYGMTHVSSSDINDRLAREGIAGSARVSDSDRPGVRAFIGYQWHEFVGLEAGFVDLGEITTRFSGTEPTLRASDLEDVRPGSGRGVEASLVGRYPLASNWHALARVGLLRWRTGQQLEGAGGDNSNGYDAIFGLGMDYRFHEFWSARLSVDRYRVENDETDFIGFGVSYHFGGN